MLVLASVGCARSVQQTGGPAKPSATDIYRTGEARYSVGAYEEAVQLWRHAILELPQTAAYDDLRHKLVCRLAYGQLMAWSSSADTTHLYNAKQMLDRYLARHQSLRGPSKNAKAQRDDVYELLYQVESRLPAEQPESTPPDSATALDAETGEPMASESEPETETETETDDTNEDETRDRSGDGDVREVVVTRQRPSVDDPRIRQLLSGQFTDPFSLNGLTTPGPVVYHEPRPMLRRGAARASAEDITDRRTGRRVAGAVFQAAREEVADCFTSAYARQPGLYTRLMLGFTVEPDGSVSKASVVEGSLGDPLGDLCVIEALENTRFTSDGMVARQDVALPLTLWMSGAIMIDEWSGRSMTVGHANDVPFNGIKRRPN